MKKPYCCEQPMNMTAYDTINKQYIYECRVCGHKIFQKG